MHLITLFLWSPFLFYYCSFSVPLRTLVPPIWWQMWRTITQETLWLFFQSFCCVTYWYESGKHTNFHKIPFAPPSVFLFALTCTDCSQMEMTVFNFAVIKVTDLWEWTVCEVCPSQFGFLQSRWDLYTRPFFLPLTNPLIHIPPTDRQHCKEIIDVLHC